MAKRINTTKLVALLAVLCMITSAFVGSTLAKYTTSGTGTDTARVAKWDIDFGNTSADGSLTETFTFDLFKTITDTDGTSAETDIASANSDRIIAPGTTGKFQISLNNKSEVSAKYSVEFTATETGGDIPIEYSLTGGDQDSDWTSDLSTLSFKDTNAKDLAMNASADSTETVYWRWAYHTSDTSDKADTTLGEVGTATVKVEAKVTVTQVD